MERIELSCGGVLFTRDEKGLRYLLITQTDGLCGFAKGHLVDGETEEETALREIAEETGVKARLLPDFRAVDEHPIPDRPGVTKRIVYFLAEFEPQTPTPQAEEIAEIRLLPYEEALSALTWDAARQILKKAQARLLSAAYRIDAATQADLPSWLALQIRLRDHFPGLETDAQMEAYRQTVLRFMGEGRALCARAEGEVVGYLLYSTKHNMLCQLAVAPEHRRRGIASALIETMLRRLDPARPVTVTTFREGDEKGIAPRALYARFGFVPGEAIIENGYPVQIFIKQPQ